jgi:hypothetical protein
MKIINYVAPNYVIFSVTFPLLGSQNFVLKHLQIISFLGWETQVHIHITEQENYSFIYFNINILGYERGR